MMKEDILSRFLHANETDETYLRDIILNFVIAGKDTTAATLSWFIYMLCKYPLIQEKVVEELKKVVDLSEATNFTELASRLNEENLEKMYYLHAVITETLRLYPAVPVVRKCPSYKCFFCQYFPSTWNVLPQLFFKKKAAQNCS